MELWAKFRRWIRELNEECTTKTRVLVFAIIVLLVIVIAICVLIAKGFQVTEKRKATKIMLFGGWPDRVDTKIEVYYPHEPERNERLRKEMFPGREDHSGGLLADRVVVTGGVNGPVRPYLSSTNYFFANQTWAQGPSMNMRRRWAAGAVIGNIFYICGGSQSGYTSERSCEFLSLKQNKWILLSTSMITKRRGAAAAALGQFLYVAGGEDSSYLNSVERYNTISGAPWQSVSSMNEQRFLFGFAPLESFLFACGGRKGYGDELCERYDPRTNRWTNSAPMNVKRQYFLMVNFNENLVVMGGRVGASRSALKSVEIYNLTTDKWQTIDDMIDGREDYVAVAM